MGTWNSRGLRGSLLEELINRSNEAYRTAGLALVQDTYPDHAGRDGKKPTLYYSGLF